MPARTYEWRSVGSERTVRSILDVVAANEALVKSEQAVARAGTTRQRSAGAGGTEASRRRAEASAAKEAEKNAKAEARAREFAAREVERAEKKKLQSIERSEREARKIRDAAFRAEEAAKKEQARNLARHDREAAARARATAREQMRAQRASGRGDGGRVMSAVGGALFGAGATMVAGGTAVGAAGIRDAMAQDERARQLAVAGGARDDHAAILRDAQQTAVNVRGTKAEDVLSAQQKYVQMTGDLAGARKFAPIFSQAARATGARDEDIAATAATLQQKFKITDPEQMKEALARMIEQGKSGAFEMGDASRYFTELGAAGSRFGLDKGTQGAAKLGALAQVARMSTGSGAEASTAAQAALRQLVAKSDLIKQYNKGQEVVFADKGKTQTKDVVDVMAQTIGATGGNLQKLQKVFGEEGIAGVSALAQAYTEATSKVAAGTSEQEKRRIGEKAVADMLNKHVSAGGQWSTVMADMKTNTNTASAQMTQAWQSLTMKISAAVLPHLAKFATGLSKNEALFDALAGTLGVMAEAVNAFVEGLYERGIIDRPTESPEKVNQEKREEIARVEKSLLEKQQSGNFRFDDPEVKKLVDLRKEVAKRDEMMSSQTDFDREGFVGRGRKDELMKLTQNPEERAIIEQRWQKQLEERGIKERKVVGDTGENRTIYNKALPMDMAPMIRAAIAAAEQQQKAASANEQAAKSVDAAAKKLASSAKGVGPTGQPNAPL